MEKFDVLLSNVKSRILEGGNIQADEAYALAEAPKDVWPLLWDSAAEVTRALCPREFESCSIVNARSGRCPENCKWCAQSAHFHTKADVYPLISEETCLAAAEMNRRQGIKRFSIVTSGRALRGKELDQACGYLCKMRDQGGLGLCASMGLLDAESMRKLRDAGVTRYHCNLETAPSHFPSLCTTHTIEDKISTILNAKKLGMEICSGGIIGMGETMRQRVELALELRRVEPCSIPINILCPIPGTPLEASEPLPEDEILTVLALFRLVHPRVILRFAGGRAALSRQAQLKALHIAMNGAIMGDMLTTIGSQVDADKKLVAEAGLQF